MKFSLKKFTNIFFLFVWCFFFIRINFYIDLKKNILQFNYSNWFNFLIDFFSISILLILIFYLLKLILLNKKIPVTIILILYPISALLGYFNNPLLQFNTSFVIHHFVMITSLILFITTVDFFIESNYYFYELLLKILILITALFFFFHILPIIIIKLYNGYNLRVTAFDNFMVGNFLNISLIQNVNGQARILFILQLFILILFRKFNNQKKLISNFFFFTSLFFLSLILEMQSRYIVLASIISFFAIILSIKNLNFKKKILYIIPLLFIIIIFFDTGRFSDFDTEQVKAIKLQNNLNIQSNLNKSNTNVNLRTCNLSFNAIDSILSGRVCGWEILIKNMSERNLFLGNGFFADQKLLEVIEKKSSNSWINILFNSGILSFSIVTLFIISFLVKFFRFNNINHQNIYISFSYYILIFILCRSLLEDTLAFINIDLMILTISLLIIKNKSKESKSL